MRLCWNPNELVRRLRNILGVLNDLFVGRSMRTAGLALAIVAVAATSVPTGADPGVAQTAQPPHTRAPRPAVAVRAAPVQPATPPSARPDQLPLLAAPAVPSVDGAVATDTPAEPVVVATDDRSPGWEQRMGEAALTRLDYPWEALGVQIAFLPARSGYLGLTFPKERRIEMFVRDGVSVDDLARNTAHELGHALDWARNTPATRALFSQIRGIDPGRNWFACSGCTDLSTPAGDFAETFSFWLMGGAFPSRSKLGSGPPTADQLRELAALFAPA
jgi:hypothetical protein